MSQNSEQVFSPIQAKKAHLKITEKCFYEILDTLQSKCFQTEQVVNARILLEGIHFTVQKAIIQDYALDPEFLETTSAKTP